MADGNGTGTATDGGGGPLGPDSEGAKPVQLGPNLRGSYDWHELIGDLIKAREAMPALRMEGKGQVGSRQYPYANLATLLEITLGPLRENGLTIIQAPDYSEKSLTLTTVLVNKGGQWISNVFRVPCERHDAQSVGSAETYGRRYALMALLALCGEDDDGKEASRSAPPKETAKKEANASTGNKMTSGKDLEANPAKVKLQQILKTQVKCPKASGPELFDAVTAGKFTPSALDSPATAKQVLAIFEETAKSIPYENWMQDIAELRNHCTSKELDDFAGAALP